MFWRRKPDVETTVEAGSSDTAGEAMLKWARLNALLRRFDLDLVSTEGKIMVLRGRPKNIEGFRFHYDLLKELDQI